MTDDDTLLTALRNDWRRPTLDVEGLAQRFAQRRRETQRKLVLAIFGAILFLGCFVWLSSLALSQQDATLAIAALAFAAALPLITSAIFIIRRERASHYPETQLGFLMQTRIALTAKRIALQDTRCCAIILVAGAAALTICEVLGVTSSYSIFFPTAAWLTTAAGMWCWQLRRGPQLTFEAERCEHLIREFELAEVAH